MCFALRIWLQGGPAVSGLTQVAPLLGKQVYLVNGRVGQEKAAAWCVGARRCMAAAALRACVHAFTARGHPAGAPPCSEQLTSVRPHPLPGRAGTTDKYCTDSFKLDYAPYAVG